MKIKMRRPSSMLLLGIAALLVAATGSAVAVPGRHTSKINGSSIKKHSIPGNRLKANALTGRQINESRLGTVPNVARLGGLGATKYLGGKRVFRFFTTMAAGDPDKPLGTFGPLRFIGRCETPNPNPTAETLVKATSPVYFQGGMSPLALLTSSSPAQGVSVIASSSTDADEQYPLAFTASRSFVLSTVGSVGESVDAPAGHCVFFGYLDNDGTQ
jgi:hypothetical protein